MRNKTVPRQKKLGETENNNSKMTNNGVIHKLTKQQVDIDKLQ